jgi:type IV secretory pathway protease TraF
LFKSVAAVAGDVIVVGDAGVIVNGVMLPESRPLLYAVADPLLALPVLRGRFLLKAGEFWTYGSGMPSRSYDSRYFGAVKLSAIRSVSKIK